MPRRAFLWTALAAFAGLVLAGCAEPPLHAATVLLTPGPGGTVAEVNLLMDAGQTVSWEWEANATELYFNVHRHGAEGAIQILVQHTGNATHAGSFTARDADGYSLYWLNVGERPILLSYSVRGDVRLDPDHPPVP